MSIAGTQALYKVRSDCGASVAAPTIKNTREYFIQAEEGLWNYGPTGVNGIDGTSLTDPERYFFSVT